jgi:GNAT superfamily N-acetyltransferase
VRDRPLIHLLGDCPDLIPQVGRMRWLEWGHGEESPEGWTRVTAAESGVERLPLTLVATDAAGSAVGAVALGDADDALTEQERCGRSPWLLGMVVRSDARGRGTGRGLLVALEDLARARGYQAVWVATGDHAVGFYRRCGWTLVEELRLTKGGWLNHILTKRLEPRTP